MSVTTLHERPAAPRKGLVLVTGGSGHLGANLVRRLLDDGHAVRALQRPGSNNAALDGLDVERVDGDLRDPEAMRRAVRGCARVFHAAAKVSTVDGNHAHKREIFDSNVLGTRHVLAAALEEGVSRVVVTGSFSAVGHHLDDPSRPADETVPFYPYERSMPYEVSKVGVEHEVLRAVARGLDAVVATSCAIVGPNDFKPSRMGRTLIDFSHRKVGAYIPGGFEFVTSRDIVEGHVLAMEKGRRGEKYVFSSGFQTLDDVLDVFAAVTGQPKPRLRLPTWLMEPIAEVTSAFLTRFFPDNPQRLTPGAVRILRLHRRADTTKARTELGFAPTSFEEAIRAQYDFFQSLGWIKTTARVAAPEVPAERARRAV